ncbi:MAG: ribonuclease PH [Acidobacteria bacterium]|nr:ribonuclease PH [Acidobacteriota bacterium]
MNRADKRAADELRPVKFTPNFIPTAEGSVLIEVGATRVVCTASVEEGVPPFQKGTGRGWITSEYSMLPRATLARTPRDSSRGRLSGRSQEIQRLIGRSLRAVARLDALGERTIWVDCDVLQADGGTRTAAITGGYVALGLACQRLVEMRILRSIPLADSVAATSVGLVDGLPLLDLTYEEDSRAQVDMNVVSTGNDRLVEVQATAEGATFSEEQFTELLALARRGLRRLLEKQQEILQLNFAQP